MNSSSIPTASILLVDDNVNNLIALESILSSNSFELIKANSGAEALEIVKHWDFAVILLDVMMPDLDGFAVAERLKSSVRNSRTPLIFMTAYADNPQFIAKGYAVGAVDYLTKPLISEHVRAKVQIFVELWQRKAEVERLNSELETGAQTKAKELVASHQRFKLFVEGVKDYGLIQMDSDGKFITWNIGAERLLGYDAEAIIGLPFSTIFTPDDIAAGIPEQELGLARLHGKADDTRWHIRRDGSTFWAHGITTALHDENATLCGYAKVLRDYTESKRIDDALRASEANFRLLAESLPQIVWTATAEGCLDYFNQRWYAYSGHSRPATVEAEWLKTLHPEDKQPTLHAWRRAIVQKKAFEIEHRLQGRDLSYRWFLCRAVPVWGENRQLLRWLGTSTDIDVQRRLRNELSHANERSEFANFQLRRINDLQCELAANAFDSDKVLALALEGPMELTRASGAVIELIEGDNLIYSATAGSLSAFKGLRMKTDTSLSGKAISCGRACKSDDTENDSLANLEVCRRIGARSMVCVPLLSGSKPIGVLKVVSSMPGAFHDGDVSTLNLTAGFLASALDHVEQFNEKENLLAEISRAKEIAEEASRSKSDFLANMSHEIRTPLGAILGFTDLLKEPELSESERQQFLETITRNGRALSHLIDDILDLSKVEAGKLGVESLPLSLHNLMSEVMQSLSFKASEQHTQLTLETIEPLPTTIVTDPVRLRQILFNIIGNAIKFTPRGQVTVTLKQKADRLLVFTVKDNGRGISPEQASDLFQVFSQADSSTNRKFGGTGLGLVLARKLASLLGGDVVLLHSTLAQGSTFEITIDPGPVCELKPAIDVAPEQGISLQGVRVLLAEDSPDNQFLINRILKNKGADVDIVANGRDAIRQAMAENYDILLMDIQMPEIDGYDATQRLRQKGYLKPIIALTAHAMRDQRERSLKNGCNDHLTKPINPRRLISTVSQYAGRPLE